MSSETPCWDDPYSGEWRDAFRGSDPSNPNHNIHDGATLCGTDTASLGVATDLGLLVREILLHPGSDSTAPDRYCETCLQAFRARYEFALDADELACPECGTKRHSCTHPSRGTYKCHACGWEVTDDDA